MKIKHPTRFEIEHHFVAVFVVSPPPLVTAIILSSLHSHGQSWLNLLHNLFFFAFFFPLIFHVVVVIRLLVLVLVLLLIF